MSAIDFKEIPLPTKGAERDQFEFFARDFLKLLGFEIIIGPDRGADAGRDLVIEEQRKGIAGETTVRWLVSCKHKAHSGASVTPDDESDIHDRLHTHGCKGFLGFYSTLPSSGLAAKLNAPSLPYEVQVYDSARIEATLLASGAGLQLARRYFPKSADSWEKEHPSAVKIFAEEVKLNCKQCGANLLDRDAKGIIVYWKRSNEETGYRTKRVEHVYWCCKGACDRRLKEMHYSKGLIDAWEDIPELMIPIGYIRIAISVMNELNEGIEYSEEAFSQMKDFLLNIYPFVCREPTSKESGRINELKVIPPWLGGWGY